MRIALKGMDSIIFSIRPGPGDTRLVMPQQIIHSGHGSNMNETLFMVLRMNGHIENTKSNSPVIRTIRGQWWVTTKFLKILMEGFGSVAMEFLKKIEFHNWSSTPLTLLMVK